ncbi:MAG: T9SS type A sorting domain-containing protein [Bacteroidota bacterium]|nr:MAG: T9SS type A sorting domain-containing protein [Bacteroidota bacterium]
MLVASKAPQGNSQLALNYQIEYKMPQSGHNYYRLKQVDADRKSSYHAKVIDLLRTDNNGVVKIYPNPANEALHIDWNAQKAAQVEIKVIDMSGRTVHVTALQAERGAQTASIALNGLSAGVYSVQFIENGSPALPDASLKIKNASLKMLIRPYLMGTAFFVDDSVFKARFHTDVLFEIPIKWL